MSAGNKVSLHLFESGTQEVLAKALQKYDDLRLFGESAATEFKREQVYLTLLFRKAKEKGMTRDQAIKLMTQHVSTAAYRAHGVRPGEDRHVLGVIEEVFR